MRIFDDVIRIAYHQAYLVTGHAQMPNVTDAFRGQSVGLCGAGVAGTLFLVTGTDTGAVHIEAHLFDGPPPVGNSWEDVVEVHFSATAGNVALVQWAEEARYYLELPAAEYRVRYCASGLDEAHDAIDVPEIAADVYRLEFWPSDPMPPAIDRVGSRFGAAWHKSRTERG